MPSLRNRFRRAFAPAIILLSINYYINRDFYPAILAYQVEDKIANFVKLNNIAIPDLASVDEEQTILNFHLQAVIPQYSLEEANAKNLTGKYVFTTPAGIEKINSLNLQPFIVATFNDFHVSMLTGKFINKNTRQSVLNKTFLVKIN